MGSGNISVGNQGARNMAAAAAFEGFAMTRMVGVLLWSAGIAGWYIIRYPFERRAKKIGVARSIFDRRESSILAFAFVGLFLIPGLYAVTGFPAAAERPLVPVVGWLGLVPQATALWLFRRSHLDLGRNWSISLEIRDRHALVETGVYRLIRHPMYSSFFLLGLAQLLLLPNWVAGPSGIVGAAVLYACRVGREEQMMLERFGDHYRDYMAHTKQLIPWII